jgi:hypothetical protein
MYARARKPQRLEPIEQRTGEGFRRTWLRRSPADVAGAGRRLGTDIAQMIRPDLDVYPDPSDGKCGVCSFRVPCQALHHGQDAAPILLSEYRPRPPGDLEEGRLGGGAWSTGRGAAPPRFRGRSTG